MRISDLEIQNFRSLKSVSLKNLGNMVVLIGANSSGKSNVLEALAMFFGQFDAAPSRALGAVSDYIWFDRDYRNPVVFKFTLELDKSELDHVLGDQGTEFDLAESGNKVEVTRVITGTPQSATLATRDVSVNGKPIVQDSQFVHKESKPRVNAPPGGQQPPKPPVQATELLGRTLQGLSQLCQKTYVMIYAARNYVSPPTRIGDRTQIIQPTITGELAQIGQSLDRQQIAKWGRIEDSTKKVSPAVEDLRVISNQVTLRESNRDERFPISLVGGGHQEVITIIHQLVVESDIFGIEEPEMHLHPQLARRLFNVLNEVSNRKQIFLATHSTMFVDHADLARTVFVRRKAKETVLETIAKSDDLAGLFYELGVRPSDVFFANGVLFVEGESDKVVFPILAKTLGIDFRRQDLSVISTRGKSSGKYHLALWTEVAKNAGIPYFMVLDKDAKQEAEELSKGILTLGKNLFLLKKGTLEEYFPKTRVQEAVKAAYGIETDADFDSAYKSPIEVNVEKYLKEKKLDTKGWKVVVGKLVAAKMSADEIDDELKGIIERIGTGLRLSP